VAFATLLADGCGEDLRWLALALATAAASVAAIVGLAVGGRSLVTATGLRRQERWTTSILAGTALAWSIAIVSAWLPTGLCHGG
jgi:hypothetical protein